jgi:hypothetical protein
MKVTYMGDNNYFDSRNLLNNKMPCFIIIGESKKLYFDNQFDSKFECDIDFECDPQEIFDRTSSVCGGKILMSGHCMMNFEKIEKNIYRVTDFDYYSGIDGWHPVIKNGELYEVDFSIPVDDWPKYKSVLQEID